MKLLQTIDRWNSKWDQNAGHSRTGTPSDSSPVEKYIEGLPSETQKKTCCFLENSRPQLHILEHQNTKFCPEISCFKEKSTWAPKYSRKNLASQRVFVVKPWLFKGHKNKVQITLSQRCSSRQDPIAAAWLGAFSLSSVAHPLIIRVTGWVGGCWKAGYLPSHPIFQGQKLNLLNFWGADDLGDQKKKAPKLSCQLQAKAIQYFRIMRSQWCSYKNGTPRIPETPMSSTSIPETTPPKPPRPCIRALGVLCKMRRLKT